MKEVTIRTMHKDSRVYINKYDVIKLLETIRKEAMTTECRTTLQRIVSTLHDANQEVL